MKIPTRIDADAFWRSLSLVLIVLGVVGYPLISFLSPGLGVGDTRAVSVPFRALVLALSLAILLRWGARIVHVQFVFLVCFGLFWALYLFRLASDAVPGRFPLLLLPWWEYWLFAIGVSAVPALAALVLPPRVVADRLFWPLLGALALAAAGNAAVTTRVIVAGDFGRLAHEALNPISIGHLGASLSMLALVGMIGDRALARTVRLDSRMRRLILPLLLMLGLGLLLLSASRGPILALLAAVVILLGRIGAQRRLFALTGTGMLFFGVGTVMLALTERLGGQLLERIGALAFAGDVTLAMRLERWDVSWRTFLESPLVGGALETPGFDYPHNVVLEAFMATGLVGGVLFSAVVVLGCWRALKLAHSDSPCWWLGLLTIQFTIAAMLSGTLYSNAGMWFLLCLTIGSASKLEPLADA